MIMQGKYKIEEIINELEERFDLDEDNSVPYFINPSYESAILGYSESFQGVRLIYSYDGIIQCLMEDGMDEEEAMEFFSYNIERTIPFMGENHPIILQNFIC